MDLVNDTMRALAFLSRVPVPQRRFDGYDGSLSDTVRGFPLAGMLIALPAALALLIAHAVDLPEIIAAFLLCLPPCSCGRRCLHRFWTKSVYSMQ